MSEEKRQKIGIFGLGQTGIATYLFLKDNNNCICYDDKLASRNEFILTNSDADLKDLNDPLWQKLDKIIMSPGVPRTHNIFNIAKKYDIEILSDIDLIYQDNINSKFIAITGTNGKSTTTSLINHILKVANISTEAGGNLGIAALKLPKAENYILELSSFQLDLIKELKPYISVLLNITPDHLDRHINMENYIHSKNKIFQQLMPNGFGIIGIDNELTHGIYNKYRDQGSFNLVAISALKPLELGISVINSVIYDNFFENISIKLQPNNSLLGSHNAENIAAAFSACKALKIATDLIISGINSFVGLPHRMQFIGSIDEINFYNDSKATNAEAASKSITALDNIYWLAGGIAKVGGIESLKPLFHKIKKAYLFGLDKNLMKNTLEGYVEYEISDSMEEAFYNALRDAKKDTSKIKNILLAPAAASYDQFKNFGHRGDVFIELAQNIIAREGF